MLLYSLEQLILPFFTALASSNFSVLPGHDPPPSSIRILPYPILSGQSRDHQTRTPSTFCYQAYKPLPITSSFPILSFYNKVEVHLPPKVNPLMLWISSFYDHSWKLIFFIIPSFLFILIYIQRGHSHESETYSISSHLPKQNYYSFLLLQLNI